MWEGRSRKAAPYPDLGARVSEAAAHVLSDIDCKLWMQLMGVNRFAHANALRCDVLSCRGQNAQSSGRRLREERALTQNQSKHGTISASRAGALAVSVLVKSLTYCSRGRADAGFDRYALGSDASSRVHLH